LDALLGEEVDSAELTSTGDTSIDDSSTHDSSFDELDFGGLDDLLNDSLLEANPTANDSLTDSFSNLDTDLDEDFAGLDALLDTPSESPQLTSTSSSTEDDFADLEAMLGSDPISTIPPTSPPIEAEDSGDEFDDLEKLLESADQTLGGSPTVRGVRSPVATANRRPTRSTGVLSDQTMRVSVKNLDNFNNLVGELVVNRNSLEQAEERLRQFLDNLLYQVQQLSDVGQRMRDLYERSLLESSLLSSRRSYQSSSSGTSPAAASSFIQVGGSVSYLSRIALPPDAILTIRVLDIARAGAPARVLAEQRYELNGAQVPIPFSTTLDRDLIGKKARLSVQARIEHRGKLRFVSDKTYPPLKDGQPVPVDIVLKPAGRAAR